MPVFRSMTRERARTSEMARYHLSAHPIQLVVTMALATQVYSSLAGSVRVMVNGDEKPALVVEHFAQRDPQSQVITPLANSLVHIWAPCSLTRDLHSPSIHPRLHRLTD